MKRFAALIFMTLFISTRQDVVAQSGVYEQIDWMLQASQPEKALRTVDSLEKTPGFASSSIHQSYKVKAYISLQRYEEAIQLCTAAIQVNAKDSLLHQLYFLRSIGYEHTGKRTLAIQDVNKASRLKPSEISYYLNLSFYYGESKDYKNCLSKLEKALKLEPENYLVLNNLSYYSSMNGQFNKGKDYANQGMKFAKTKEGTGVLLNNRGFAYIGLKNYDAALNDIGDALKLYPENAYAYFNKALVYMHYGNEAVVCENLNMATLYGYIYPMDELMGKYCK